MSNGAIPDDSVVEALANVLQREDIPFWNNPARQAKIKSRDKLRASFSEINRLA
jgi:hypothetical protein